MPDSQNEPHRDFDVRALVLTHAVDIVKLRGVLEQHGVTALDNDLAFAWANHSAQAGVAWAPIPENTRMVLTVLLRGIQAAHASADELTAASLNKVQAMRKQALLAESWNLVFEELPMNTGGGLLHLPPDLCIRLGLRAGHQVEIRRSEAGEWVLQRVGA